MKKLIMCQGLPGSGKSTWAEQQRLDAFQPLDPSVDLEDVPMVVVVNKDRIRVELNGVWSKKQEEQVIQIRDERIQRALRNFRNVTVISDDTNFARHHRVRLAQLASEAGATFEIKRFDVPLEECIRRVQARTTRAAVPEQAIRDMWKRYVAPKTLEYPPAVPVPTTGPNGEPLPYAAICDLDGTLSLLNGRNPYDASTADRDLCNEPVRNLLEVYYRTQHYNIIYLSGRMDTYRPQTDTFLRRYHCPPGKTFMRKAGDYRPDWVVKSELFDAHIRGQYCVKFVLDDRNQVVNYWRHLGLTCFQVAPGDF